MAVFVVQEVPNRNVLPAQKYGENNPIKYGLKIPIKY